MKNNLQKLAKKISILTKRNFKLVFIGGMGVGGAAFLALSFAGTITASFEAEQGSITGSATTENDFSASAGQFLKFGSGKATHILGTNVSKADGEGNFSSVKPGDTVLIKSGVRGSLRIENFTGAPGNPITFINDGGVVEIRGSGEYAGVDIRDSKHIRVTGTGINAKVGSEYSEAEQSAGIKISGTQRGVALKYLDRWLSELPNGGDAIVDAEVDHIDIGNITSIGVHASDGDLNRSYNVIGMNFHHLYIHDLVGINGEGFYIGSSSYTTGAEHIMGNIQIHHNYVARIPRDGIQVGSAPSLDSSIHHNVVHDVGLSGETSHAFGIIINRGTSADVYNNLIYDSAGDGIYDQGLHGNYIYNNVVLRSGVIHGGAPGIDIREGNQSASNPDTPDYPRSSYVFNNTIVGTTGDGIGQGNTFGTNNQVRNNIIRGYSASSVKVSSGTSSTNSNNLTSDPQFVNSSADDYHLLAGSPAIDTGFNLAGKVDFDFDDVTRPKNSGWDIGAFEFR